VCISRLSLFISRNFSVLQKSTVRRRHHKSSWGSKKEEEKKSAVLYLECNIRQVTLVKLGLNPNLA
jgi:hypothetical protein